MYMNKTRKNISLVMSVLLCLQMLTGCESAGNPIGNTTENIHVDTSEDAITNLTVSYTSEIYSQNPFRTTYAYEMWFMCNLYEGLMVANDSDELVGGVAEYYEASEDYKTWTFHLRDDCYWVNCKGEKLRRVTADDFVTGLEWTLNYGKNEGTVLYASTKFIEGAQEYFDYTESLTSEEAQSLSRDVFLSMVKVEATDEDTIVYHCVDSCPYFQSVVTGVEFFPAPQDHIDEIGIEKFVINNYGDAWFNGPYVMSEFVPNNERILDANPHWYGNEEYTRFLSVTFKAVSNSSVALQLYKNNEIDYVELYLSQVKSLIDKQSPYADYLTKQSPSMFSIVYLFNFQKYKQDGTVDDNWNKAIANKNFRLSWYYGLDTYNNLNSVNPLSPYDNECETLNSCELVKLGNGRDYCDLVESKLNLKNTAGSIRRLDSGLFEKYKEEAIQELSGQGVSFPIIADYYVPASSQSDLDAALLLKNTFKENFGDDYIQLNIVSYSSSYTLEVEEPQKYSFVSAGWGADYMDPSSVLSQYCSDDPNAYEADLMNINNYTEEELDGEFSYMKETVECYRKFDELYNKALLTIDDLDKRYDYFADAEAYLIQNGFSIPAYNERGWCLTKIDLSNKYNAAYGICSWRYVNLKTDSKGYTNEIWKEEDK